MRLATHYQGNNDDEQEHDQAQESSPAFPEMRVVLATKNKNKNKNHQE
jgi:hypothetical protein